MTSSSPKQQYEATKPAQNTETNLTRREIINSLLVGVIFTALLLLLLYPISFHNGVISTIAGIVSAWFMYLNYKGKNCLNYVND